MTHLSERAIAEKAIDFCRRLAGFTEEPGRITRTFLSPPMHDVHRVLREWMQQLGMAVSVDAAGNLRAVRPGPPPRLIIGSHLDTVPNAGAFDGILGVVLGMALVEALADRALSFAIEVVGFSEEEGVRFGIPFIGSRALVGDLSGDLDSRTVDPRITDAIRAFGLGPETLPQARLSPDAFAYLEFHIEQGPVLESLGRPLAVVDGIVGMSRLLLTFQGKANHAGTTPMPLRHDALAAAAEWMPYVEREALATPGLVATVGSVHVEPNAINVIPGLARVSLDVRHATDAPRRDAVNRLLHQAGDICARRGISLDHEQLLDQDAVAMDPELVAILARAASGAPLLTSGAGHDAMILAPHLPSVMLFLRSPGGISHHPDEAVLPEDVAAALAAGLAFIHELEVRHA